jgi:hypothetical protein
MKSSVQRGVTVLETSISPCCYVSPWPFLLYVTEPGVLVAS